MSLRIALLPGVFVAFAGVLAGMADAPAQTREKETHESSLLTLRGHERWVSAVTFSPDGKRIISGSGDATLKAWDSSSGKELLTLRGSGQGITALAVSRDGTRIVAGNWNGTLIIWDAQSGKELRTLRGHAESITSIAFRPDGQRIVSGSGDDTLKVWDAHSGKELLSLDHGNEYDITCVAFSPDGKWIVSGDGENALKVWEADSGEERLTLFGHDAGITCVAFSPDGKRIVSGSIDDTLRVWDAHSGKELLTLQGHSDDVTCLAFGPNGKRIVSGSENGTMKVWDAHSGKVLRTLRGHSRSVTCLAFSPDGERIVSGSKGTLKVWKLPRERSPQAPKEKVIVDRPVSANEDTFQKRIAPFLQQHCYGCHGPRKQESGVRLDQLIGVQSGNRHLWTMIHEKISAREMPPADRPQPVEAAKQQLLTWIREQQRALGTGGTRRLNRRELSAALQDVTGLAVPFWYALPGDGTVAGFDTGADGLQEASDAVAQWLQITRRAVDGIRFLEPAKGKAFSANLRETKEPRKALEAWRTDGITVKVPGSPNLARPGLGLLLEPRAVGERESLSMSIPASRDRQGILRLTLVLSAMKPLDGIPNPHLWVEIGGKDLDYREITGTADRPQRLVYEVHLGDLVVQPKGVSIHLSNKVEVPYAVKGFENEDRPPSRDAPPGGGGLFRPRFDRRTLPLEKQPIPFVVLHRIDIEPEVVNAWPPPHWRSNVGDVKDDPECARRLLRLWIERAWRRPVSEAEQAPFLKLYQKVRGEGMSFDNALRAAFQSVLLSAPFRYQASPAHPDRVVAQYAIASRLSFLLMGAPPDAQLRRLAEAGKLREPAVLDTQVDRLLADPRSQAFVRPFVTQWLEMEQPITIAQAHINKQDFRFARYLKASMREETIAYVAQMLADNRPVRELIDSDWTMMNDILARHYGYDGIEGGAPRKVKLRPDDPHGGGILAHAGLQSMLCWMGDNWVIYRGAWTLRHILDHPPPPPPLEVPELNPSDARNRGKTFRELLQQHQNDTRCAVCHKTIDPVGFAFQNFDISGRWRSVEHDHYVRRELDGRIVWQGAGETRPVDTAGRLPRGETFRTFAEFKRVVIKDYETDVVRGLLKNFLIYATGRVPAIDDRMEIRAIMKKQRSQGYPLRDLLKGVVRSRAFLEEEPSISEPRPSLPRRPK